MTLVCAVIGGVLLFSYVSNFGVNVPINDDWDHVETSLTWAEDGIGLRSLFALHNEHCLALPRLWNHTILVWTCGDYRAVLLFNAGLAMLLLVAILLFVGRLRVPFFVFSALSLALALAVSSWSQWQNLLWAFQTPFFVLPLLTFLGVLAVCRLDSNRLALALAICITWIAVITSGNGLFVGLALVPAALLRAQAISRKDSHWWTATFFVNLALAAVVTAWLVSRSTGQSYGGFASLLQHTPSLQCMRAALFLVRHSCPRRFFTERMIWRHCSGA